MSIKIKFILIIIILFIFLGSIVVFYFFKEPAIQTDQSWEAQSVTQKKPIIIPELPENMTDREEIEYNNKIFNLATSNRDAQVCQHIIDQKGKDTCTRLLAIELKDQNICSNINDTVEKQACLDQIISVIAIEDLDIQACSQVMDQRLRNGCITNIISASNYTRADCDKLNDTIRDTCLSQVIFSEAMESTTPKACEDIPSEDSQVECLYMFFGPQDDPDYCNDFEKEARDLCQGIILTKLALKDKDVIKCEQIEGASEKERCIKQVEDILDPDNDGLTNYQERRYKTDPQKSDTDGDGYSDGDEVKSGYNPLGEGKLE